MSKSILFYFNSLQPSGGIERVISTLANKLCTHYDITILVKDPAVSFYPLNSNVRFLSLQNDLNFNMESRVSRIFTAFISALKNTKALRHFLNQNEFDNYYLAHPLNVLEFHLARGVLKKDTIVTEHGGVDAYNAVYKRIKAWLYPKAKIYVVPTTTDTKIYKDLGYPAKYLPHFRSDLIYERSKLDNQRILTIGRFTDVKQHMLLLRIWKEIINEVQPTQWKLQLIGQGELKQEYLNYVKVNKIEHFVEILTPSQNVSQFYKSASVFVLTSKSEGFGMVLLEAISFGLPCISFDCPAGPRDIINNKNGFLIAQNDEKALKNAIMQLMIQPQLLNDLGQQAFLDSRNWQDEDILNLWHQILN